MNNFKYPVLNVKSVSDTLSIDLTSVKSFLRIDISDDDSLITRLIKTATTECEAQINKTIIEKTYIYSIYDLKSKVIHLPFPPVKSITSIKIIDYEEKITIVENTHYYFDGINGTINFDTEFSNFYRIDIEYIAGMIEINPELIQALLMHIASMYENKNGDLEIPVYTMNVYSRYKRIKL